MWRPRWPRRCRSSIREQSAPAVGYKRAMTNARRFALDELTLRPGTYFNPQTEIMIVIDDSPEVDHELFEAGGFESDEWVLISEEIPVDEHKRDDLVERFQQTYQPGAEPLPEDDVEEKDELEEDEEDDELDGVEGL
jgi:hypothetical protein